MGLLDTVMQYAIYIMLAACLACLAAAVAVFYAYERRWQERVERDALAVMRRGLYKAQVRDDTVLPCQRPMVPIVPVVRHQVEDMQIVADEANSLPYKNVA